jgi:hypothetical protein
LEIRSLIRQYKMYHENRWPTPLYTFSTPETARRFSPFSNISLLQKRLKLENIAMYILNNNVPSNSNK